MPWRASCPGNIQSLGDGSGPLGSILGRKAEDEVYADVVESGIFEYAVGLNGSCGIVTAVHPFQDPVIERLHPHTDTVHTHIEQGLGIAKGAAGEGSVVTSSDDAYEALEKHATDIAKSENVTPAVAFTMACDQHPELYAKYVKGAE